MRRRFGRGRRRGGSGDARAPIDAALWMGRIAESGLAGVEALEPFEVEGIDEGFAAVGRGSTDAGEVRVAFSPRSGGDALFAVVAAAEAEEGFAGRAVAVAPHWDAASRRHLAVVAERPYDLRAVEASQLGERGGEVEPETLGERLPVAPERVAHLLERTEDREIFLRALAGLEGLAAKHGGVVRGAGDRAELVLLARRVATLEVGAGAVTLEVVQPERSSQRLDADGLATALDRLEGALRKRLNDRRVRSGEEGLRAALLPVLERTGALSAVRAWPAAWRDREEIDLVGVGADGRWVAAAARAQLTLETLGGVIDAALDDRARLAHAWIAPDVGVRSEPPRLLLAAQAYEAPPLRVLATLRLGWQAYDVVSRGNGEPALEERGAGVEETVAPRRGAGRRGGRSRRPQGVAREEEAPAAAESPGAEGEGAAAAGRGGESRFEEVSLFDLDEDGGRGEGGGRRRRGRGGRRRGRRGRGSGGEASEGEETAASEARGEASEGRDAEAGRGRRTRGRRRGRAGGAGSGSETEEEGEDEGLVDEDALTAVADDVPEIESDAPLYDEDDTPDEGDDEVDRQRREREQRRRARLAKSAPAVESAAQPRPPRRRAAFVAHADRHSVLAAVLLARDVRLVEGFWVYPQEDLMTFFRSVATDLREGTPIFLVGFYASPPARDTIQAASLYRGRLHWFDHHDWPPEDLVALQGAIGEEAVHIEGGAESSLASVIAERTRRSRFSDKLVELATGRFTQHDYERWGRLWWQRIGEMAERRGERRADIDPLLAGRPSDLAKEAANFAPPPPPPELEFVSRRDFRLVHFGGYVMVVLEVPEELDLHLAARIARERYEAQMSLALPAGGELLVLGGEEGRARRGLDLGSMAEHLASKHEWITALRDDDHVARVRVRDLQTVPGRLDEVISEIAMGRSIVEG